MVSGGECTAKRRAEFEVHGDGVNAASPVAGLLADATDRDFCGGQCKLWNLHGVLIMRSPGCVSFRDVRRFASKYHLYLV